MNRKLWTSLKVSAAAAVLVTGFSAGSITSEAREVPYYNITTDGGTFDGQRYTTKDGVAVTDCFFCDGTYTYYLQYDGTPMKDRLTYHPDGEQVIYFDAKGRECFDTFANVKQSIEGKPIDDLCYFGTFGNLYVNVITYNKEGTAIYYANPYGVMERSGVFELDTNATNYELLANGCHYGFANSDGSVQGFYATYEEAAAHTDNSTGNNGGTNGSDQQQGEWKCVETTYYDKNGRMEGRAVENGNTTYHYSVPYNGDEYLSYERTEYYDANGENYGYMEKDYMRNDDGSTWLYEVREEKKPEVGDWVYCWTNYYENGQVNWIQEETYIGSDIQKKINYWDGVRDETTTYEYKDGKIASYEFVSDFIYSSGEKSHSETKTYCEYDSNGLLSRENIYKVENGAENIYQRKDYSYVTVAGEPLVERVDTYNVYTYYADGVVYDLLESMVYEYDEYGNEISEMREEGGSGRNLGGYKYEYTWIDNEWVQSKYECYSDNMAPFAAQQDIYNFDGVHDRHMVFWPDDNGQWKLSSYTDSVINFTMPQDTTQPVNIESERTYDSDGNSIAYAVKTFKYIQ